MTNDTKINLNRCPDCGSDFVESVGKHEYVESGLNNVNLKEVIKYQCPTEDCGRSYVQIKGLNSLHLVIGLTIILQPNELAANEVRFLRKHLGLTIDAFSKEIGLKASVIHDWETKSEVDIDLKFDTCLRRIYFNTFRDSLKNIPDPSAVFLSVASGLPQCVNPSVCNLAERAKSESSELTLGFLIALQPNELKGNEITFLRNQLSLSKEQLANKMAVDVDYLINAELHGNLKRPEDTYLRELFVRSHKGYFENIENVIELLAALIEKLPQCNYRALCGRPLREVSENLWMPQKALQNAL